MRGIYAFIRREARLAVPVDIVTRIKMYSRGFFSESAVLYDFIRFPVKDYLTDIQRLKTESINGEKRTILDNKILFEKSMPDCFNVPENILYIRSDESGNKELNNLYDKVMAGAALVLKPVWGGGGDGVFFLENKNGELNINGKPKNIRDLSECMKYAKEMLVCKKVVQSAFCSGLFNESVNTLRVLTVTESHDGDVIIAGAIQRIGVSGSAPMDNVIKGGVSVYLDTDKGILGRGAAYPLKASALRWTDRHPETGKIFQGLVHPQWENISRTLKNALKGSHYPPYVGWDIVATEHSFSVIEGNNYSGVSILQMHRPLLSDARVRKFYRDHGILK